MAGNGHGQRNGKNGRRNVRSRNGFTRNHKNVRGGPPAHKNAVDRARQLELITNRQWKAFRLFTTEALTFEEIGKRLGVSDTTAFHDCIAVKKAMPQVLGAEGVDLLRHGALERHMSMLRTHMKKLPDPAHAAIVLRLEERLARLIGYDAQPDAGPSMVQVAAMLQAIRADVMELVPEVERRRAIAMALQRRSGLLPGAVIDVPPKDGHSE